MSKAISSSTPLSFKTNTHATMNFDDAKELAKFAEKTSTRLASVLHVLMETHQEIDGGFLTDILEVANDMAYQMQQAVDLMSSDEEAEVSRG